MSFYTEYFAVCQLFYKINKEHFNKSFLKKTHIFRVLGLESTKKIYFKAMNSQKLIKS